MPPTMADLPEMLTADDVGALLQQGDRFITDRLRVDFLGRQSFTSARPGLRALCSYIADNSTRALAAGEVRALLNANPPPSLDAAP